MVHLSIRNLLNGNTFCGRARSEVFGKGEEVFHPNVQLLEKPGYRGKICSECLAIWDNPELPTTPVQGIPLHRAAAGNQ
ncbi:hypothetical protein FEV13_00345 (plasmid) [Stutzerimonas degradans]|nr:hypothetical protein FEV13_00345 [Stutzerimonas degradans]